MGFGTFLDLRPIGEPALGCAGKYLPVVGSSLQTLGPTSKSFNCRSPRCVDGSMSTVKLRQLEGCIWFNR